MSALEPTPASGKEKRKFVRIDDRLPCHMTYVIAEKEMKADATILDISGGGIKVITKEFLKKGQKVLVNIGAPLMLTSLEGEVINSKLEWYLSDQKQESRCTANIQFSAIPMEKRKKIIQYVYRLVNERRTAHIKHIKGT